MTTNESLLTDEEREAILRPIDTAKTLPNRAFTSREWFELEVERIYRRTWVALCFEQEVVDVGDVLPRDLVGIPLVVIRDAEANVSVFHNVCAYDGCPVALEPQRRRETIRAPYHGWRYDLRGRLVGIPYWDGTPQGHLESLGDHQVDLVPVATATFLGVVFVNLSESPQPFDDYIAPLAEILEPWDLSVTKPGQPSMVEGGPLYSYAVQGNWKTYYENTCVNVLHEGFTHVLYEMSSQVPRVKDGVKTYWDLVDRNLLALAYRHKEFEETYPALGIPHLGRGEEPENSYFAALFPNLHLGISTDWIVPIIALPEAPDRTVLFETFLMHRDVADHESFRTAREVLYFSWRIAHLEDGRVIEGVQRGRHSPVDNQKFYAPFWDKMHYELNRMVHAAVEGD